MIQTEEYYQDYAQRVLMIADILEDIGDMAMHNETYEEFNQQFTKIFLYLENDCFDTYDLYQYLHTECFNDLLTIFGLNPVGGF